MAETADDLAARMHAALDRIAAAGARDSDAAARLRDLEAVVEASIAGLDATLAAAPADA